jgi:translation initiation factor 2 alpha subunit (eIF-2alpha)
VNNEVHIDILRRLRDTVRRKRPEKWRTNSALAQWLILVKDFIGKNNVTTLEHPPYPSDLAAAYFYLFPGLKSAMKGRRFFDATDIIKNATEELKRLSQNGFQKCFQHLHTRW